MLHKWEFDIRLIWNTEQAMYLATKHLCYLIKFDMLWWKMYVQNILCMFVCACVYLWTCVRLCRHLAANNTLRLWSLFWLYVIAFVSYISFLDSSGQNRDLKWNKICKLLVSSSCLDTFLWFLFFIIKLLIFYYLVTLVFFLMSSYGHNK